MIIEQALAASQYDRKDHQPQLIHQPGCKRLAHQIAAALGQQVGAVLLFEDLYGVGKVSLKHMTIVPIQRIGTMGGDVLGHAVEQVGDDAVFEPACMCGQYPPNVS
ncbi:hypothetical protein EY04_12705 [Pseudomonas chlororaphis]|nr:hypothetical protein EY04_12705 [Pseudomonas chlororaphis]